jgi:hypothetical protein
MSAQPASALPSPTLQPPTPTAAPEADQRETRLTPLLPVFPERVPTSSAGGVTGEVPEDLLAEILADAESHSGIEREAFTIIRAEAVTWSDGSLGCPQPGTIYTQAPVNGYWVVLRAYDKELDYRATEKGFFALCERSPSAPMAPPGRSTDPTPEK